MSEYELYWLTGFLLINNWACQERIMVLFLMQYALDIYKYTKKFKNFKGE